VGEVCALQSASSFIPVLLVFVVLGLVSLGLSQEIGWEEPTLKWHVLCVEWDVKP